MFVALDFKYLREQVERLKSGRNIISIVQSILFHFWPNGRSYFIISTKCKVLMLLLLQSSVIVVLPLWDHPASTQVHIFGFMIPVVNNNVEAAPERDPSY